MKYVISISIFFVLSFFLVKTNDALSPAYLYQTSVQKTVTAENEVVTAVAVGDIMLGRFVEELSIRNNDWNYAFALSSEIFSGADIGFGNFEGSIPKVHTQTPIYGYQFSVAPKAAEAMRNAGINVVTLANNHSSDFGEKGYSETASFLNEIGVASVGSSSSHVVEQNGIRVRFMGFNDTFAPLSSDTVASDVRNTKKDNEFLVVAIHFGDEYATSSNSRQKALAHTIIDAGADVVIGHHPHVVEEHETYHGKAIFYSLGNFIFDQYFSEGTQNGLAIKMTIGKKDVTYELIPIDLHQSRPRTIHGEVESFSRKREI
ncbi:MAG: CapA family protein [Candidatus Paceibacterota bacterium]|jgi:poly-gamma-glutamate synthesis protein (capsule biosynthesis protein)|nr:CapA family protein [Candidatus Paceibacterota bacterium]